jgi:hypothetical protein
MGHDSGSVMSGGTTGPIANPETIVPSFDGTTLEYSEGSFYITQNTTYYEFRQHIEKVNSGNWNKAKGPGQEIAGDSYDDKALTGGQSYKVFPYEKRPDTALSEEWDVAFFNAGKGVLIDTNKFKASTLAGDTAFATSTGTDPDYLLVVARADLAGAAFDGDPTGESASNFLDGLVTLYPIFVHEAQFNATLIGGPDWWGNGNPGGVATPAGINLGTFTFKLSNGNYLKTGTNVIVEARDLVLGATKKGSNGANVDIYTATFASATVPSKIILMGTDNRIAVKGKTKGVTTGYRGVIDTDNDTVTVVIPHSEAIKGYTGIGSAFADLIPSTAELWTEVIPSSSGLFVEASGANQLNSTSAGLTGFYLAIPGYAERLIGTAGLNASVTTWQNAGTFVEATGLISTESLDSQGWWGNKALSN